MDRAALVKTLELASRALADTDLIPIYKCFAFNGKTVMAYNDLIGIVAPCNTGQKLAMEGVTLLGLLKNRHVETADLQIDGHDLVIKVARSTFKLPFFPLEDFMFEEPEDKWDVELPISPDLLTGLQACLVTSSRDQAQPALLGVNLTQGQKRMILYSSDGDAVSEYQLDAKSYDADPFMLPNSFCEALLSVTGELEMQKGTLKLNGEWAKAVLDNGYILYGRIIENDDPLDFADQIKQTIKAELSFVEAPEGLDHALSRARVLADRESDPTVLTVESGRLRLVTTTKMGVVRDTLAIAKHPDVEAQVSSAFIQRSLALCSKLTVHENCTCFKSEKLFVLIGNMN